MEGFSERTATSRNGIAIRLTLERWLHISGGHNELEGRMEDILRTVSTPDEVREGRDGALLAVRKEMRSATGSSSCIVKWETTALS